jgi:aminomethyltransferase
VWCLESGGCVEDVIVYKQDAELSFVIVNAGNREKDLKHLKSQFKICDQHALLLYIRKKFSEY